MCSLGHKTPDGMTLFEWRPETRNTTCRHPLKSTRTDLSQASSCTARVSRTARLRSTTARLSPSARRCWPGRVARREPLLLAPLPAVPPVMVLVLVRSTSQSISMAIAPRCSSAPTSSPMVSRRRWSLSAVSVSLLSKEQGVCMHLLNQFGYRLVGPEMAGGTDPSSGTTALSSLIALEHGSMYPTATLLRVDVTALVRHA
jgi:hypothetical protein